ncbi:L-galactonate dehydratase [Ascosphaera pollenicola]|nr:L-galactonate dehydratase [Ascosphaera pollenicola]
MVLRRANPPFAAQLSTAQLPAEQPSAAQPFEMQPSAVQPPSAQPLGGQPSAVRRPPAQSFAAQAFRLQPFAVQPSAAEQSAVQPSAAVSRIHVPPVEEREWYSPNDRRGVGGNIDRMLREKKFNSELGLDDTQLKEVLAEIATMAVPKNEYVFRPEFRTRYIPVEFKGATITDSMGNKALVTAIHRSLLKKVKGVPGIQSFIGDAYVNGTWGFCFHYRGSEPTLPPFFDDVPNVVLKKLPPMRLPRRYMAPEKQLDSYWS